MRRVARCVNLIQNAQKYENPRHRYGAIMAKAVIPSDADKAAVAAVAQRIVTAWANHDADAFSKVFIEEGSMILPGLFRKGRSEIRSFMSEGFAGPYRNTQVTGTPLDIQFLSSDSAVLTTEGGVLAKGETEVSPEQAIRASWIVVKRDGEWSLAAYQNSPK
jgi:uncharacterized protein (TIGR02246 family)